MTDFEDRLTRALTGSAEEAPGATMLADGARCRTRVRRRRVALSGAVAAVLAVVVPLGIVRTVDDGAEPAGPQRVDSAGPGWQTVALELEPYRRDVELVRLIVDVPNEWIEVDGEGPCVIYSYGAPDGMCETDAMNAVADSGGLDYYFGPGLRPAADYPGGADAAWSGHVNVGDLDVSVASDDVQVALRVLGSARLEGEVIPDLSGDWASVVVDGVEYRAPDWDDEYSVSVIERRRGETYARGELSPSGGWRAAATVGDRRIEVVAPTQALAELVAGSARVAPDSDLGTEPPWQTVELEGVAVEVPAEWASLTGTPCDGVAGFQVGVASTPCGDAPRLRVAPEATFDYVIGFADGGGNVVVGDQLVTADNVDYETARRVLASTRPVGTPAVDVDTWTTLSLNAGVTAEVPQGRIIRVVLEPGIPFCDPFYGGAEPTSDGEWRAIYCRDRIVSVTAPTQALADVVAATVRD